MAKYIKLLDLTKNASKLLNSKSAKIYNKDSLKLIKRYIKKLETLLLVDPPYIFTNGYPRDNVSGVKDFSYDMMKSLVRMLLQHEGIFLYFCRVTATRPNGKYSSDDYIYQDAILKEKIDEMFYGKKDIYYMDYDHVIQNNADVIERVISNYPFLGFTPYC